MEGRNRLLRRLAGVILIVVGVGLGIVSGLADVIGLGADPTAFGYRQFIGTAVGLMVFVVGVAVILFANGVRQGQ